MTNSSNTPQNGSETPKTDFEQTGLQVVQNGVEQGVGTILEGDDEINITSEVIYSFGNNQHIQLTTTDKYVFKLFVDNEDICLNDDIFNDDLIEQTKKLNNIISSLNKIKQFLYKGAAKTINKELDINRIEEFADKGSIIDRLANMRIRIQYGKKFSSTYNTTKERYDFIKSVIVQLDNALEYYNDENVSELPVEDYNNFMKALNTARIQLNQIYLSLGKILKSTKAMMDIFGIK